MKITINTKEDSHEDIRKVVALLSTLIKERNSDIFESSEPSGGNAFVNMFGNDENKKEFIKSKSSGKEEPGEDLEIMTY